MAYLPEFTGPSSDRASERQLDQLQVVLGGTGMIPGPVGAAADLTNAYHSFGRGHYGFGTLDLLSALPGIGLGFGALGMAMGRGGRAAGAAGDFSRSRSAAHSPLSSFSMGRPPRPDMPSIEMFAAANDMSVEEAIRLIEELGVSPELFTLPRAADEAGELATAPLEQRRQQLKLLDEESKTQVASPEYLSDEAILGEEMSTYIAQRNAGLGRKLVTGHRVTGSNRYKVKTEPIYDYDFMQEIGANASYHSLGAEGIHPAIEGMFVSVRTYDVGDKKTFDKLVEFSEQNKNTNPVTGGRYQDVEVPDVDVKVDASARYEAAEMRSSDFGIDDTGVFRPGDLTSTGAIRGVEEDLAGIPSQADAARWETGAPSGARAPDVTAAGDESDIARQIMDEVEVHRAIDEIDTTPDNYDPVADFTKREGGAIEYEELNLGEETFMVPMGTEATQEAMNLARHYKATGGISIAPANLRRYAHEKLVENTIKNGVKVPRYKDTKLGKAISEQLDDRFEIEQILLNQLDDMTDPEVIQLLVDAKVPPSAIPFRPSEAAETLINEDVITNIMGRVSAGDPEISGAVRALNSRVNNRRSVFSELPRYKQEQVELLGNMDDPVLFKTLYSDPGDVVTFKFGGRTINFEVFDIMPSLSGDKTKFRLRLSNGDFSGFKYAELKDLSKHGDNYQLLRQYAVAINTSNKVEIDKATKEVVKEELVYLPKQARDALEYHGVPVPKEMDLETLIKSVMAQQELSSISRRANSIHYAYKNMIADMTNSASYGGLLKIHQYAAPGDRYPAAAINRMRLPNGAPLTQVTHLQQYGYLRDPAEQMKVLNREFTTPELLEIIEGITEVRAKPRTWEYNSSFNEYNQKNWLEDDATSVESFKSFGGEAHSMAGTPPPQLLALKQKRIEVLKELEKSGITTLSPREKDHIARVLIDMPERRLISTARRQTLDPVDELAEEINKRLFGGPEGSSIFPNLSNKDRDILVGGKNRYYGTTEAGDAYLSSPDSVLTRAKSNADNVSIDQYAQSGGFGEPGNAIRRNAEVGSGAIDSLVTIRVDNRLNKNYRGVPQRIVDEKTGNIGEVSLNPSKTVAFTGHRPWDLDLPSGDLIVGVIKGGGGGGARVTYLGGVAAVNKAEAAGEGISVLRKEGGQHFGNPFSHLGRTRASVKTGSLEETVGNFEKWLEGSGFTDLEPARRQWILDQIDSGALDNTPLLYYSRQRPNHAEVLKSFIDKRRGGGGARVTTVKRYNPEMLQANPDKIYLFGDNLQGKGKGGQAIIRDEPNAFGIPTKKSPSRASSAYFNDAEFEQNVAAIDDAFNRIPKGKEIVLPEDGLGTGLAKLKEKAPKTYEYLQERVRELKGAGGGGGVYEVSSAGDKRFSALSARLKDGRTIEKAYQVDVKGYRSVRAGKGKPPMNEGLDTKEEYLNLWRQWADENPELIKELASSSRGKKLSDKFSKPGTASQADALETILIERGLRDPSESGSGLLRLEAQDEKVMAIKNELRRKILDSVGRGKTDFVSGMALGVDIWAAEEVIKLANEGLKVRLIPAIPFKGQTDYVAKQFKEKGIVEWPREWIQRYNDILKSEHSSDAIYVTYNKPKIGPAIGHAMEKRNDFMNRISNEVIAVYNGKPVGGTAQMVRNLSPKNVGIDEAGNHIPKLTRINPNMLPRQDLRLSELQAAGASREPARLLESSGLSGTRQPLPVRQSKQPFGPKTQEEALRELEAIKASGPSVSIKNLGHPRLLDVSDLGGEAPLGRDLSPFRPRKANLPETPLSEDEFWSEFQRLMGARKSPHQMSSKEYIKEFTGLEKRTSSANKPTSYKDLSADEQKILDSGDWEAFSRLRGYTDEQIEEYRRFLELAPSKFPQEYATVKEMHRELVEKALREKKKVPDEVLSEYPDLKGLAKKRKPSKKRTLPKKKKK